MNTFLKTIDPVDRNKIEPAWLALYNDYYNFDNRLVKILNYKREGQIELEKINGFTLNNFEVVQKLTIQEKRFIFNEVMDIYWNQFKFTHRLLKADEVFLHTDFHLGNLMYTGKSVRLIDPESFSHDTLTLVGHAPTRFGKWVDTFACMIQIIGTHY